jgi:hypothetical protein
MLRTVPLAITVHYGVDEQAHFDEYSDALRFAINTRRTGLTVHDVSHGLDRLHSSEEIEHASEELDQHFTDFDLIEEIHTAWKELHGAQRTVA